MHEMCPGYQLETQHTKRDPKRENINSWYNAQDNIPIFFDDSKSCYHHQHELTKK